MDVPAKRGAVCNTDHHLVCAKLRLRAGESDMGREKVAGQRTRGLM